MGELVRFPQVSEPAPVGDPETVWAHPSRHVPSLGAAVESFFASKRLAANTVRSYRSTLGSFVADLGEGVPGHERDGGACGGGVSIPLGRQSL